MFIDYAVTATWPVARATCQKFGADLPVIRSANDNNHLVWLASNFEIWIGLYQSEIDLKWYWVDGIALEGQFTWWLPGDPNGGLERCVMLFPYHNKWVDQPCGQLKRFVCQITST